ncbi:hypothetical protein GCM10020331_063800 [Ectobacillus funiculus]
MTTFERYFIKDKKTHKEKKRTHTTIYVNRKMFAAKILTEFGLNPDQGHIINGHTPVKEIEGEKSN